VLRSDFGSSVFVNCPFDEVYAPLLEAALFCIVCFGFTPRLANERLEAGENRLDKIAGMIRSSKYSIHDLSRSRAATAGEHFRMNMPFEYGLDVGFRRSDDEILNQKKFLIFEENQYDLKKALSDIAGQDVVSHNGKYEAVIKHVRDFFRVEAGVDAPGPSRLITEYATFQGWMTEKKIYEGHSERDALILPTRERLDEMRAWVIAEKPLEFVPS
tara:strand:+ start:439 stop:1083 length:645 start_codon:yes stop_codon:yes gene_type:complete